MTFLRTYILFDPPVILNMSKAPQKKTYQYSYFTKSN